MQVFFLLYKYGIHGTIHLTVVKILEKHHRCVDAMFNLSTLISLISFDVLDGVSDVYSQCLFLRIRFSARCSFSPLLPFLLPPTDVGKKRGKMLVS